MHKNRYDCWIAVDGKVYDITEHVANHPGWHTAGISTPLSILAHSGTDCSEEFRDIHRPYPQAWRQLQAFYIGELAAAAGGRDQAATVHHPQGMMALRSAASEAHLAGHGSGEDGISGAAACPVMRALSASSLTSLAASSAAAAARSQQQ